MTIHRSILCLAVAGLLASATSAAGVTNSRSPPALAAPRYPVEIEVIAAKSK